MNWSPEMDAQLQDLAAEMNYARIGRLMGIPLPQVWRRALHKNINAISPRIANEPTLGEWVGIAREVAAERRVQASSILLVSGRARPTNRVARARWAAWERLLAEYPQYTVKGLSRVCGRHHATILRGLKMLKKMEAEIVQMAHDSQRQNVGEI